MSDVIKKYGITFSFKVIHDEKVRVLHSSNAVITKAVFGMMPHNDEDFDTINEFIDGATYIIENPGESANFYNEAIAAFVDFNTTKFAYMDFRTHIIDFNNPIYTMPTLDFRDILIEWKKFMETSI